MHEIFSREDGNGSRFNPPKEFGYDEEMRAWRAESSGPIDEVLHLTSIDLPQPGPGQIAVKVRAAAVALPDLLMLRGIYPLRPNPPCGPGMEVAGEIIAIGEGVSYRVGDRVMAIAGSIIGWGSLAEECLADASRTLLLPDEVSDHEGAGFPVAFLTAYAALKFRTPIRKDQTLLVLGAGGSSGAAAVILGKALGARVLAVTSNPQRMAFCRSIGADEVLDRKDEAMVSRIMELTSGEGVDVVFDPVGGETAKKALDCMARHGQFALVGFASGEWAQIDPLHMVLKNYAVAGMFAGNLSTEESQQTWADLHHLAKTRQIVTPVGQVFPFSQVPQALHALQAGEIGGRIIIDMSLPG